METFILIVMLCTADANYQEYCVPLTEEPRVYYKSEKDCIINLVLCLYVHYCSVESCYKKSNKTYAAPCISTENLQ